MEKGEGVVRIIFMLSNQREGRAREVTPGLGRKGVGGEGGGKNNFYVELSVEKGEPER